MLRRAVPTAPGSLRQPSSDSSGHPRSIGAKGNERREPAAGDQSGPEGELGRAGFVETEDRSGHGDAFQSDAPRRREAGKNRSITPNREGASEAPFRSSSRGFALSSSSILRASQPSQDDDAEGLEPDQAAGAGFGVFGGEWCGIGCAR